MNKMVNVAVILLVGFGCKAMEQPDTKKITENTTIEVDFGTMKPEDVAGVKSTISLRSSMLLVTLQEKFTKKQQLNKAIESIDKEIQIYSEDHDLLKQFIQKFVDKTQKKEVKHTLMLPHDILELEKKKEALCKEIHDKHSALLELQSQIMKEVEKYKKETLQAQLSTTEQEETKAKDQSKQYGDLLEDSRFDKVLQKKKKEVTQCQKVDEIADTASVVTEKKGTWWW